MLSPQVLNDSELVDFVSAAHPDGADGYYFVKNPIWRSSEDVVQLRRLERSVNLTMHESQTDNSKILDVRLHLPGTVNSHCTGLPAYSDPLGNWGKVSLLA